jgi:hypothetical protein
MPSSTLPRSSGKPICGTPIVEGKDAPAVVDHQDRTVAAVNNEPSLRPEFCEAPCEREFRRRRIHGRSPVNGLRSAL